MEKSINKFAIVLWISAALVAVSNLAEIYFALDGMSSLARQAGEAPLAFRGFFSAISGTITPVAMLIGIAALIEIVDQIRWNARPKA